MILVMQALFDLSTPAVSFLGHAGGVALGLSLGLLLSRHLGTKRVLRSPAARTTR